MRHSRVNVYLHNLGKYGKTKLNYFIIFLNFILFFLIFNFLDISFVLPGLAQKGVHPSTVQGISKNKEQLRTISFNSFR